MTFFTGFSTSQIILWMMLLSTTKGDIGVEFIKQPTTKMVNPKESRGITFRCSASPTTATIEWIQNGQKILDDPEGIFRIQPQKLTIKLPKNSEESGPGRPTSNSNRFLYPGGLFLQCLARHKGQAIISQPAKLIVAKLSPFSNKTDYNLTVIRGNTALIPCKPPYSVPNSVTEFEYNGVLIQRTKGRYLLQPSGNIQILNAQMNDSGIYQCIAHNPYLAVRETSKQRIRLIVTNNFNWQATHFVSQLPETTTVFLGSNITLECTANGYPVPNITWFKRQGKLPHNRRHQIAGNLLLFEVSREDKGVYVCKADNGKGSPITTETLLEVQEIPQIIKLSRAKRVNEGESVSFDCQASGQPKPELIWYHNGAMVQEHSRITIKENRLSIHQAKHHHGGIYQCSANNELGADYATSHLTVISNENISANSTLPDGKHHHHNHHHKNKHNVGDIDNRGKNKRKKGGKIKMIPPTKPNVHRLSDDSVMVSWDVPQNDGLPIQFFKVQYKEVGRKQTTEIWNTIDEDIAAHITSYAVTGLKNGAKYRFRIAAVFSNYDNKSGPKSSIFTLQKDSQMKKPLYTPVIIYAKAISPSAIIIRWEYPNTESVSIEGYFVYYRATHSAGEYSKLQVLGSSTHSHIITHLLPETSYDIKMQSFIVAGVASDFSNIYTSKTDESEQIFDKPSKNDREKHDTATGQRVNYAVGNSSNTNATNRLLYIILGVALGVMAIVLIIFLVLYNRKKKQRRQQRRGIALNSGLNSLPVMAVNGNHPEGNGYRTRAKINISVNPLSEVDTNINGESIYPLVLQYQEVPSNNNEVILLSTLERSRRRNDNSDLNHGEDCQPNNRLISSDVNLNQTNVEMAETAT